MASEPNAASRALLETFRSEHEEARKRRGERPMTSASEPNAASRALIEELMAENAAAAAAARAARVPAAAGAAAAARVPAAAAAGAAAAGAAAREGGRESVRTGVPGQAAAAAGAIHELINELYSGYTDLGTNVLDRITTVSDEVKNKVSISTIFSNSPSNLRGALFHGNITAALDVPTIKSNRIGLIIQTATEHTGEVSKSLRRELPDLPIIELEMNDRPGYRLETTLDRILPQIARARRDGINVLVVCSVGMSRSTSVILAHLMDPNGENMTLLDAWRYVKRQRPLMLPNIGFLSQLMRYERRIRGSSSVPIELFINHPAAMFTLDPGNTSVINNLKRNLRGGSKRKMRRVRKSKRKHYKK